jgi:hypothetical protein
LDPQAARRGSRLRDGSDVYCSRVCCSARMSNSHREAHIYTQRSRTNTHTHAHTHAHTYTDMRTWTTTMHNEDANTMQAHCDARLCHPLTLMYSTAYTYTYAQLHTHRHKHTHAHTHTHTHIHTRTQTGSMRCTSLPLTLSRSA